MLINTIEAQIHVDDVNIQVFGKSKLNFTKD